MNRCAGCNKPLGTGEPAYEAAMQEVFCVGCCVPVVISPTHDLQLVLSMN